MTPLKRKHLISYILEAHPLDIFKCQYCGTEFVDKEDIGEFPVCNQLECQLWLLEGTELEGREEIL